MQDGRDSPTWAVVSGAAPAVATNGGLFRMAPGHSTSSLDSLDLLHQPAQAPPVADDDDDDGSGGDPDVSPPKLTPRTRKRSSIMRWFFRKRNKNDDDLVRTR